MKQFFLNNTKIEYDASIKIYFKYTFLLIILLVTPFLSYATHKNEDKFVVVLDAGHGGKDFGAHENGAREKDINLQVALKVGDLIKKRLKDTKVVFTRDDDTFISLQQRAEIANMSKADFFISIHTNSVDTKNKNRSTVAGASVYTQGPHKDEANLGVAMRENSVIELENGFEQKYSGFDPSKDESYIIFEMAQKKNLTESARFAKDVQTNLVNMAGRKDRGVHQAGFWVLWSTSMPSVLIELDFICNPESAKYLTSKEGVEELSEAIFQTVKVYEQNFLQKQRMIKDQLQKKESADKKELEKKDLSKSPDKQEIKKPSRTKNKRKKSQADRTTEEIETNEDLGQNPENEKTAVVLSGIQSETPKDLSHVNLSATRNQKIARYSSEGRKRRSGNSRAISEIRDITMTEISISEEPESNQGFQSSAISESMSRDLNIPKERNPRDERNYNIKEKDIRRAHDKSTGCGEHGGGRKSLKSRSN